MRKRSKFSPLRWLSLALTLISITLFILQLIRFSRLWANFPSGLTMAGIPVGQLDRQQAAQRLLEVYSLPVELHYGDAAIQLDPSVVSFELDLDSMLAAAELERVQKPFWNAFWDYLWGIPSSSGNVPLRITYSEERLRDYLVNEIAARYDRPPTAAVPVPGTVNFTPGAQGTVLDVDRAVQLIDSALRSTTNRIVDLPLKTSEPERPDFRNLEILLQQIIEVAGYDGVAGIYLHDLQNAQEINLNLNGRQTVTTPPDIAFTASSTIKIPIMVSVFRRLGENIDPAIMNHLTVMMGESSNPSSDALMETVLDPVRGPIFVTEDLKQLHLDNTFLAGFFYTGAPMINQYITDANSRTDITTKPDPYSQTTPAEIGQLLVDIYQCAQTGGGTLIAMFPGEITQSECQQMDNLLRMDHAGVLIQAGVPDGTRVAHKHGWVVDSFGVIHDMSDAAIVYTPGGNYVLTIFLYHPTQLVWDQVSKLFADLSRAVYNFYNLQ